MNFIDPMNKDIINQVLNFKILAKKGLLFKKVQFAKT